MKEELNRVAEFHRKMRFAENGGEDMLFRMALIAEEVGEIAACLTKNKGDIAEEHADLLILVLGNCVSLGIEDRITDVLHAKLERLMQLEPVSSGSHARVITGDSR
ncbi:hypothetical protein AB0F44_25760 [Nocardioides sp. NPDC023903]|uniref:hypothetical protein n=1 Tax=Nocardioides sp. NPDC023903 TaxID=3157195 RepID=UPI0033FE6E84